MEHREQHLLLIKSPTDGQRLRTQIRLEREQIRRRFTRIVADVKATLTEADKALRGIKQTDSK